MRVVASLAQPVLFLFVFGSGLSSSLRGSTGGFGGPGSSLQYVQFIFPGIIGMSVLFTSIFGAMSIVWDREFGFLKEVLVAPIHRSAVAIGKTLGGATQAMFQGIVILVLAPLVGVKLTFLSVVELVPMIFLFAFALSALGVAVAARMRTMQGFQMVMNFLMMPMFFLAGALFPLGGNLPAWLSVLTRFDPASYGIDALRRTVLTASGVPSRVLDSLGLTIFGQPLSVWPEEAVLLAFGVLMLSLAVYGFRQRD
jgi:ABC-2 type transport system permease protein